MAIFTELEAQLLPLSALIGDVDAATLPAKLRSLTVDAAHDIVVLTSALIRQLTTVQSCAAGVVAEHSSREAGRNGFAQQKGHRSPVSLVQEIMGSTRAEAIKQIRVGESLLSTDASRSGGEPGDIDCPLPVRWHAPLDEALLRGRVSHDQHEAIRRGLGEPPIDANDDVREWTIEAWSTAAEQLIDEAAARTVEELRISARTLRDLLDPAGAARRFDERFQGRSFRIWTDRDGIHRGSIQFDDEAAAWVRSITDAALRPRRGGPRFVDAAETARAKELEDDPRTNDQLTYDLIIDVLRAGALADAKQVFGTRQAGIRVVVTAAALSGVSGDAEVEEPAAAAVGHCEDGGQGLPAWLIQQRGCDAGQSTVITDRAGNPLYLGRESRLFSAKQKVALAVRDGGCRWRNCDRPASYCESHHIDHYVDQHGRTDIDRGILLCRWHHMQLHHGGWQITRRGHEEFLLHPPDGREPISLPPRLMLRYAWDDIATPDRRFRLAA